jgi:putative DNA primase/helicase
MNNYQTASAKNINQFNFNQYPKPRIVPKEETECIENYGFYDKGFTFNKGVIKQNMVNYKIIINHFFPSIQMSEFDRNIYIDKRLLNDSDLLNITEKVITFLNGATIKQKDIEPAVKSIANENKFDQLKDYFLSLEKTKTNYIDNWLTLICNVNDNEINRIIGRKWLISCVARAMEPGCYIEGSLIFYGEQQTGKTWLFTNLNPDESYYCGSNVDLSNIQKASQTYQGKFIIEFAELSCIKKANLNDMKAYLTAKVDTYVEKYSNLPTSAPRRMVFGGSTNEPGILTDTTGNRRFWCVESHGKFNYDLFLQIKKDLWAEAYQSYLNGEAWTLTESELLLLNDSNTDFNVDDPFTEFMSEMLDKQDEDVIGAAKAMEIAKGFDSRIHPQTISKTMIKLGWKRSKWTSGSKKDCICYKRQGTK